MTILALAILVGICAPTVAVAQSCSASREVTGTPVFDEDFGTGTGRTADANVRNHNFQATGNVQDDNYAVGRSNDHNIFYMSTDTNGDVDASGSTNGRYLGINMRGKNEPSGSWNGVFYRVDDLSLNPGAVPQHVLAGARFSVASANLCDQPQCNDLPDFELRLIDSATNTLLGSERFTRTSLNDADEWITTTLVVDNIGSVTDVDIVLFNLRGDGNNGNDIGFDDIVLTPFYCPNAPALTLTKSADTTQLSPAPLRGETVQYTLTVANAGNVDLDQAAATPLDTMTYGVSGSGAAVGAPMSISRDPTSPDNNNGVLEVGETIIFRAEFILDQTAVDAGGLHNTATATGDPVRLDGTPRTDLADVSDVSDNDVTGDGTDGGAGGTDADPTVVTLASMPTLDMTKIANAQTNLQAGDTVIYTYRIENTGNVTIDNISIADVHNGSGPAPTPVDETLLTDTAPALDSTDTTANDGTWTTLAPGDVITFTGQYTVTQQDVDTRQ